MSRRERVYRALLSCYPQPFREQHAASIAETLLDGAAHRGTLAELRELGALAAGSVRAHGDAARRSGHGSWRHGASLLLAPLAAVNLGVVATAFWVDRSLAGRDGSSVSIWWLVATSAAAGLAGAIALRRRGAAIAFALLGLVPLGYDEWHQATGSGDLDHFSQASLTGRGGPLMSPSWLFLAGIVLVATFAWRPRRASGRPSRRLGAIAGGAVTIALLVPASLQLLLVVALVGAAACVPLGGVDRRLHGIGFALWVVTLPYVAWWWMASASTHAGWFAGYLALPSLTGSVAWVARRRRRRLVA